MKTKTSFTPGPWFTYGIMGEEVRDKDATLICKARSHITPLISAAPELLFALKVFVDRPGLITNEDYDRAKAAIAKAEGRE